MACRTLYYDLINREHGTREVVNCELVVEQLLRLVILFGISEGT